MKNSIPFSALSLSLNLKNVISQIKREGISIKIALLELWCSIQGDANLSKY
jgi:hypothetical protein